MTTDAEGRYEITGLPQRKFFVLAETSRPSPFHVHSGAQRHLTEPHPRNKWYPNEMSPYSPATVALEPGERSVNIDFNLPPEATFCIHGTVEGDEKLDAVNIWLIPGADWDHKLPGGVDGRLRPGPFDIGPLWAGEYWLIAYSGERSQPGFRTGFLRIQVPGQVEDGLKISVRPALPVTIRVHPDGGVDAPWSHADPPVVVELSPLTMSPFRRVLRATVPASGGVSVESVPPEPHQISVAGLPRGWVVRSIVYNGRENEGPVVEFSPTASAHTLDITVAPINNAVSFRVFDQGRPMGKAMVMMKPAWLTKRRMGYSHLYWTAAESGELEVRAVPPGEYEAIALPPGSLTGTAYWLLEAGGGVKVVVTDAPAQVVALELQR